ncbi:hypothetical protein AK88_01940 [Plasmodium fragile]|uniref:Uncharacterized protein n=1 Tax=Plasmodium fragile TaxID=5857 RepID=A0A0D9QMQ9_PLAFR|nr:uncharacterized protein AK88_01940 [Plasmodium fragile]KJP88324.1 hypothetical protein AK88_01940 [Plasmodium fragile]
MTYATLGALLADYVIKRGLVGDPQGYMKSLWKDIEAQLDKFIQHLKDQELDEAYSVNCKNTAWQRPGQPTNITYVVTNMGDRIICRLMTKALYFLNGWSIGSGTDMEDATGGNRQLRNFIRCTIVHMFMHLLNESACASTWGTFYAWYSMRQMGDVSSSSTNLVYSGDCVQNSAVHLQVGEWSMQHAVKEWLNRNVDIKLKLNRGSFGKNCRLAVPKTTGSKHAATDQVDEDTLQKIKDIEGNLQTAMRKVLRKIKKEVKEEAIAAGDISAESSAAPESDDDDDEQQEANGKNSTGAAFYSYGQYHYA